MFLILEMEKKYDTEVTLKNMSGTTSLLNNTEDDFLREMGFELRDLTRTEKTKLGVNGSKVISIYRGSKIERTNMDPDFIITKVNDKEITKTQDVIDELKNSEGKIMLEGIYEGYPDVWYYAFAK